jgi:hypothetical protein
MNRRQIYHGLLIAWLAAFILLGFSVWSLLAGHVMVVMFLFLSAVIYALYAFLARCPRCRMPILLRPVRALGVSFYVWSIVMPTRCRHCGKILS